MIETTPPTTEGPRTLLKHKELHLITLNVASIHVNSDRVRAFQGHSLTSSTRAAYLSLVQSIQQYGLMQPILVAYDEDAPTTPILVAGLHRLMAHKDLGLTTIQALYTA
jgi:ParB-like chromosome segregation protein Spo0J